MSKKWLRKLFFFFSPAAMGRNELLQNPERTLMVFRPSMLETDFQGRFPERTLCLYSRWSGYLGNSDWQRVQAALQCSQGNLAEAHTSGHIYADDIAALMRAVQPKALVPIHTFEPERFESFHENVLRFSDGEPWALE